MNNKKNPFEKTLEPNMKFGELTIVCYDKTKKLWKALCDCGKITYIRSWAVKKGKIKSCGCYNKRPRKYRWLPNNISLVREMIKAYKQSAKRRGHEFNIEEDQFHELILQDCFYCSAKPEYRNNSRHRGRNFKSNGIDRLNNTLGYIDGNIVTCCERCNMAKRTMSVEEFKSWILRAYTHMFTL